MIIHGILTPFVQLDDLIHVMNEITENDAKRVNKKVNWKETSVYDNSNPARYQKFFQHRERWK